MIKSANCSVTFETKVYEKDWEYLLKHGLLKEMIDRCDFPFDAKRLWINNVQDADSVSAKAQDLVHSGVLDSFDLVEEKTNEVLSFFDLTKESLGKGYYYSISELAGIYSCTTKYLLHFASDSMMKKGSAQWISEAIHILEQNPDIAVANPVWNDRYGEAETESSGTLGDFFKGFGFSDQCYLIETERFKRRIYNYTHPDSQRYPEYGGELFEKRIDAYMRSTDQYRITSKKASYLHRNYPRRTFSRAVFPIALSLFGTDAAFNLMDTLRLK